MAGCRGNPPLTRRSVGVGNSRPEPFPRVRRQTPTLAIGTARHPGLIGARRSPAAKNEMPPPQLPVFCARIMNPGDGHTPPPPSVAKAGAIGRGRLVCLGVACLVGVAAAAILVHRYYVADSRLLDSWCRWSVGPDSAGTGNSDSEAGPPGVLFDCEAAQASPFAGSNRLPCSPPSATTSSKTLWTRKSTTSARSAA